VPGGRVLSQEVILMVRDGGPVGPDRVRVVFDDRRAVAAAGVVLPATPAARLGSRRVDRGGCGIGSPVPRRAATADYAGPP
jgi:hypothetical protein